MRIGYGKVDITPSYPVELSGFAARRGKTSVVHDRLHCKSLYISEVLLISCDLLALSRDFSSTLRAQAALKLGLKTEQVAIVTTHTHYAPATTFLRMAGKVDEDYLKFLRAKVMEAVEISEDQYDADPYFYSSRAPGLAVNRARGEKADDSLMAAHFKPRDKRRVSLVNFACHPVVMGPYSRAISADYPAFIYRYYEERGEEAIFLNGAAGDLNPFTAEGHVHHGTFQDAEKIGRTLGEISYPDGELMRPQISFSNVIIGLETEKPAINEGELRRIIQEKMERGDAIDLKTGIPERIEAEALQDWLESAIKSEPGPVEAEAQAFALSETFALVNFSGELFSSIGKEVRSRSPFVNTMVVGYANGVVGYIPDRQAFELSTYEAAEAYKYYDTFPFKKNVGEEVGKAMLEALETVSAKAKKARVDRKATRFSKTAE
ncbi:MAG: hypothetical protein ACP5T2_05380 [Thermoprotei archaeon]